MTHDRGVLWVRNGCPKAVTMGRPRVGALAVLRNLVCRAALPIKRAVLPTNPAEAGQDLMGTKKKAAGGRGYPRPPSTTDVGYGPLLRWKLV